MKQALKDSFVNGIKIAIVISILIASFLVPQVRDFLSSDSKLFILYGYFLVTLMVSLLLKIMGDKDPFILFKFTWGMFVTSTVFILYFIVPIALMWTKIYSLFFLGLVIGCIQLCFLFSKPVQEKVFGSKGFYIVWINRLLEYKHK